MVGAPTCVGDIEYIAASGQQAAAIIQQAVTQAAIQAVIALWQRNASDSIATMQDEIAKEQMAMAEAIAAHVQSFWPELKQYIKDVFSITNTRIRLHRIKWSAKYNRFIISEAVMV